MKALFETIPEEAKPPEIKKGGSERQSLFALCGGRAANRRLISSTVTNTSGNWAAAIGFETAVEKDKLTIGNWQLEMYS